jgi:YspA, cpYpsA-related SLOG family
MEEFREKRLLVFGDRNWDDYEMILEEVRQRNPDVIIEGEARGADKLGRKAAEELGIPFVPFPAHWDRYGRGAGPIRNQQMLDEGNPTEAIGFHDNLKESKGTHDMWRRLKAAKIPVEMFKHVQ